MSKKNPILYDQFGVVTLRYISKNDKILKKKESNILNKFFSKGAINYEKKISYLFLFVCVRS